MRYADLPKAAARQLEADYNTLRRNRTVQSVTAAYTTTRRDKLVKADATSAAFTVTLHSAVGCAEDDPLTIKKIDSGTNAVTVDGEGSETIDGSATYSLSSQWDSVTLVSDGANWLVAASV